jgi:predicted aspartyl protease
MIYGRLTDGKAVVPVIFRLPTQPDFSIDFISDTRFNDHLTLPPLFSQCDEYSVIFHYA